MDIEGDEWAVLDTASDGDFDQVTQIVCEFHDFDRVTDTDWFERAERVLRRLEQRFCVVHVHGNNYGAYLTRGNIAFPEILEVTLANRGFYEFGPCAEAFPTDLDAPNRADRPDIVFGRVSFLRPAELSRLVIRCSTYRSKLPTQGSNPRARLI